MSQITNTEQLSKLDPEQQKLVLTVQEILIQQRFWNKVDKENGPIPENQPCDGRCWQWIGWAAPIKKGGHGQFRIKKGNKNVNLYAHRFAWEIANGIIPQGLYVCHLCGNARCVRASHLYLGTAKDNALDRSEAKWRHIKPVFVYSLGEPEDMIDIGEVLVLSSRTKCG